MKIDEFCEFSCDGFSVDLGRFRSLQGRICCFKTLINKIISLPFALVSKAIVTLFRSLGFLVAVARFVASLGGSLKCQEFLVRRGSVLAKDLVDWLIYPFVVVMGLFRLLIGSTIHPAVYFH